MVIVDPLIYGDVRKQTSDGQQIEAGDGHAGAALAALDRARAIQASMHAPAVDLADTWRVQAHVLAELGRVEDARDAASRALVIYAAAGPGFDGQREALKLWVDERLSPHTGRDR